MRFAHIRRAGSTLRRLAVPAVVVGVLACAPTPGGAASTGSSVVGANVLSSTSITNSCVAPAATAFGSVTVATSNLTAPCRFDFGSSNATASLRIRQLDGDGTAMQAGSHTSWTQRRGWAPGVSDVRVVSATVSFAGLADGRILRTGDDGATWDAETTSTTATINGLAPIDTTNAYAVTGCFFGCPGILKRTTAGGATWATQTVPGGITGQLFGVDFVPGTPDTAVIVGASGVILRTVDGGANWNVVASGTAQHLRDVDMVDAAGVGYVVGTGGTVLRTADAGATWVPVAGPAGAPDLLNVSSPVSGTVFVIDQYNVHRSQDANGAATWTSFNPPSASTYTGIFALSASEVYLASWAGVNRSLDANVAAPTWSFIIGPTSEFPNSVHADVSGHVKVGAWSGNIYATSGWTAPLTVQLSEASAIAALDSWGRTTVFAAGDVGHAWRSTDSGVTWTHVPTGSQKHIRGVDLDSATEAWAAASGGSIFHTTNLGTTWVERATGIAGTPAYYDVVETRTGAVIAVGASGVIARSSDGGVTWAQVASGVGGALRAIDESPDTGRLWITGDAGTILTSTSDGTTWTNRSSGAANLHGVTATEGDSAWVVGDASTALRTSDGGATWTPVAGLPGGVTWLDVDSAGPKVVTLSGGAAAQRSHTTDGGTTWSNATSLFNVNAVTTVDANTVYAGGTASTLTSLDPILSIADFAPGVADWTTGNGAFGACLQALGLDAVPATWAVDTGGVAGTCETSNGDTWYDVPTTAESVARTNLAGQTGRVDVVWGLRVGATTPGSSSYVAHVALEVVAPAI